LLGQGVHRLLVQISVAVQFAVPQLMAGHPAGTFREPHVSPPQSCAAVGHALHCVPSQVSFVAQVQAMGLPQMFGLETPHSFAPQTSSSFGQSRQPTSTSHFWEAEQVTPHATVLLHLSFAVPHFWVPQALSLSHA
jgi:hypothetical protein